MTRKEERFHWAEPNIPSHESKLYCISENKQALNQLATQATLLKAGRVVGISREPTGRERPWAESIASLTDSTLAYFLKYSIVQKGLKLKKEKCYVCKSSVDFLGFRIDSTGVQ